MNASRHPLLSTFREDRRIAELSRLKSRRKLWLDVHLWLGLTLGFLLCIYGITGSFLVFYAEIDEWLHTDMLVVEKPATAQYQPLAEIFAAGKTVMPPTAKHVFSVYPRNENAAFKLRYQIPTSDKENERWIVGVNPYSAQVTGKMLLTRSSDWLPATFIDCVFELHYALLIPSDDISTVVVGVSAALLIISTLTGLIVWWPLTGKWWQALTFKSAAGKVRFNYDLHKISGFYTALVMLPVLFSGIYMVLPHNVVPVLELFSPVTYRYWFQSTPPAQNAQAIGMDQAVAIAMEQYPQGRPHWIYGAPNPTQTYTVCQDGIDAPGSLLQRRCTVIDRYSGKILDLDDPSLPTATAGEIFTHWQWPLHSGQAFGMTGRILVFITGLACPVLFATGVIRWLQKRNGKQRTRIRQGISQ
ncbi:PepSY-associated TM helix domain-containing protein [Methylomonas methanica]|uniref:PepSY-associated TM helix domain protein n=1 Tax=Methylomonas methanica (strain DSM 25384 / MC09) TaxID=857087 RepID=G0A108_METMM|nr:PepSY-associated TM helix domain-containing protein [Methylomonas methanica]AEG01264.1 PepSY-associated TM helix domain protein [Methylomonas methanica MC09]